jgi:Tfp pilus assembly major pilin PilA
MQSRGKFSLALVMLVLVGFGPTGTDVLAAEKDDIKPWSGELPVRGSWLRQHLPESALIYLRIPHPLGFIATPKGNAMDGALRSTANVESLMSIQSALTENVLEFIPGFEEAYVRDFAAQLRSPVEIAMMLAPSPSAIVSMNLNLDSAAKFEEMIAGVSIGGSPLALLEPLDEDGFGQILGLPVPASVHFDVSSGRLLMQSGPSVVIDQFVALTKSIGPATDHKMHAMENQVDTSGHGLFFWIDAASAIPAAQLFMNEEQVIELQESGLDKARAAAVGWGAANGKGRMSVIVDMPRDGDRQFLPYVRNEVSATSVGEPDALVMLSIPTAEEFSRIEALLLESASEETRDSWLEGKAAVEDSTGITIENVLNAIGPEIIGIFDESGDYAAIRLRDAKLFEQFIQQVAEFSGMAPIERNYKRHTFYQLSLSSEVDSVETTEDSDLGPLSIILSRQREHIHWYQDGDFLYIASVPQPLIDRVDAGANTDLGKWLGNQQSMDMSTSVLAATGSSKKLPRRLYYLYIEMLQAIADVSEAEFDVWSMPTAAQVEMPDQGALGFSVNLGDPYLSIEFMFENNPLESLFSGDMTSIAAMGVLAAIAIPAYQDYTIRANISQSLNEAEIAKHNVEEHFLAEGEFPGPTAAAEISDWAAAAGEHFETITVVPGVGTIVISYSEADLPDGGDVFLEPTVNEDGSVSWVCSASIEDKLLPELCRENVPPELNLGGI